MYGRSAAIALLLLLITACVKPCSALGPTPYYRRVVASYTINEDRSVLLSHEYTLVNPFPRTVIYTIKHYIPTEKTEGVTVRGPPELSYSVKKENNYTSVELSFTLRRGDDITYTISCTARGMVSGAGPGYVAKLGSIELGDESYPYENYVVEVTGPPGTALFTSSPGIEQTSTDPPSVRYETRLSAPGKFEGLLVSFYVPKVFYAVTMTTELRNSGLGDATDVSLDSVLFPKVDWQFSALLESNFPLSRMYTDEENNYHGVFKIGTLKAGETKILEIRVLYEESVYDPEISPEDSGTISEVGESLGGYLKPDECWEVSDPQISTKARELAGTAVNAFLIAREMYNFVSSNLEYEKQDARMGALWTLSNLRGDCSEFTDLFIALCRASGVPARAIYGWGYSEENVTGHAWAQFYAPGVGWLVTDPTWGNRGENYFSRQDSIHLARCIRGLSSGESCVNVAYRGQSISFSENVTMRTLSVQEYAMSLLKAAELACGTADNLVKKYGDENTAALLKSAVDEISLAKGSGNYQLVLIHSKNSLWNSYAVIESLCNIEETEQSPLMPVAFVTAAVVVLAFAVYLAKRRAQVL